MSEQTRQFIRAALQNVHESEVENLIESNNRSHGQRKIEAEGKK